MATELLEVLQKTLSPNQSDQQLALQFFEEAAARNLPEFSTSLSVVLRTTEVNFVLRQAAGLRLKNVLTSNDEGVRLQNQRRWLALQPELRAVVKENVIETLGTETSRPSIAAQCVAAIACAELPQGQWSEVISVLMQNVTQPGSTEIRKECSLEAIGYICADIEPGVLIVRANEILTAIVHGMKKQEPSNNVRLAATTALSNSLEFTRANFETDVERHHIMQVVCEATQCTDTRVRVAALQCLVRIMSLYYQYMEQYMGPALFAISVDAMKSDDDQVIKQGVEFWSNVCDEEIALACEAEEAAEQGRPPERVSKFYAKGALQYIVPLLTAILTKQEEGDDEDDWNPSKASGVCIMLLAQCTGDDVVPLVLPFISNNIISPDWRARDAAVVAFGSILEGPNTEFLKPLVSQAMPRLIDLLQDTNTVVKDSAAWCVGKICDIAPDTVVNADVLQPLLPALSMALNQEPRVAANVCWAISSLAEAAYENAREQGQTDADGEVTTYILSSCFDAMISELLKTTERPDSHASNLRNAAYAALMELIKNSPQDCYTAVQNTTIIVLQRLQALLSLENHIQSTSDRSQFHDLQSLLCATLQSVIRKMRPQDVPQISDHAMTALLQILANPNKGGGVQEDALMAVATLVEVLGDGFLKYMDAFKPFLIASLNNHAEHEVCSAALGLVGDMCRSFSDKIAPHADEFMQCAVLILQDANVDKSLRPQVLSTFGDLCLAIGPKFSKYLEIVLPTLMQATQAEVDKSDYDAVDYLQELREACLEAYTGIIQGMRIDGNVAASAQALQPYMSHLVSFIEVICQDTHPTDGILAAASGCIGDLSTTFGSGILAALDREPIQELLTKARRSKNAKTKTLANWATKEIKKLKNASG